MQKLGVKSRSRIVQEALRLFINEYKWRFSQKVHGIIGVVYDHNVSGVDDELTDIQHEYLENIISTIHIHLTRDKCMLIIVMKSEGDRLYELVSRLINTRGVLLVRPMVLEVE
uniref:CopG family ribbon-helix-helix protein n=1 Tax=Staphylothermus marinus TaxID=2280 RepID=A0A7C4D9M8_STAMA